MPRCEVKASATPAIDALLQASLDGYFRRDYGRDVATERLLSAVLELAERCARLEAKVARHERDIAPKRRVGG